MLLSHWRSPRASQEWTFRDPKLEFIVVLAAAHASESRSRRTEALMIALYVVATYLVCIVGSVVALAIGFAALSCHTCARSGVVRWLMPAR